jgi:hypothetical protein
MKLPLILDYEIYDEDGPCAPYFTGRITDADGRVMCNAENEERAVELVDHVAALLARHNALREAVGKYCSECDKIDNEYQATSAELDSYLAARAEVDALVGEG